MAKMIANTTDLKDRVCDEDEEDEEREVSLEVGGSHGLKHLL